MALKRYYLSEDQYDYFIRLFRGAKQLSWFQLEKKDTYTCWCADIDFENIPEKDRQKLGEEYDACLERLKREVQTEPPVSSLPPVAPPSAPTLSIGRVKKKKRKRRGMKFIVSSVLGSVLTVFMTANYINAPSEGTLKKPPDFMDLLQENVSTTVKTEVSKIRVSELLSQCQEHLKAKRLTTGKKGTALNCYREVLRLEPHNTQARAGLQNIEMEYVMWAKKALQIGNLDKVSQYLGGLERVNPESSDLAALRQEIAGSEAPKENDAEQSVTGSDVEAKIEPPPDATTDTIVGSNAKIEPLDIEVRKKTPDAKIENAGVIIQAPDSRIMALLNQCQKHIKAKRLTTGNDTALACYREVLRLDPDNTEAYTGLQKMERQYVLWTNKALRAGRLKKARQYVAGLERMNSRSSDLNGLKNRLAELEKPRSKKTRPKVSVQTRKTYQTTEDLTDMSLGTGFNQQEGQ